MKNNILWRIIVAAIVIGIGAIYALPSFLAEDNALRNVLPDKEINLGLDLQGGINLTLGVDMETSYKNSLNQLGEQIRSELRDDEVLILRPRAINKEKLQFVLLKSSQKQKLEDYINKYYNKQLKITRVEDLKKDQLRYTLAYTSSYKEKIKDMTIDQVLKVVRNRINQFGVNQPDIRKLQNDRIQVQLPGLENAKRAIELVKRTALLELQLVNDEADLEKARDGVVPPGSELAYMYESGAQGDKKGEPIVLKKRTLMTGEHISDANVAYGRYNNPYVSLTFDHIGARKFERLTGKYQGKRMAIVLDDKVYSAPTIQEKIRGGKASITGQFKLQEARDLAIVLRAGSLPAPVEILQERSVGASLGKLSIQQGVRSMVVGGILILLFTIIYYGIGGVIVDTLLGFNLLLILGVLAGFGATLTLPGIAGIILLIGTAVDASVLIFERIREEFRRGMSARKAVDEGFSKSTLTIVDANVTTIIAAIILYQFGTGPIRGFAVTLAIGIVASMFTAIFVSRIFFDLWLQRNKPGTALKL